NRHADRAEHLRAPGGDPPRPGRRAGEGEPGARLPAHLGRQHPPRNDSGGRNLPRRREHEHAGSRLLMNLGFLSPLAGLVALAVLAPLFLLAAAERRGTRARKLLGLIAPGAAARLEMPVAICLLAALLGLAAAQPVLHREVPRYARRNAEAIVAFDISRSMLAAPARTAPNRLERAKAIAKHLRAGLSDTPVGVASFTDRVLPHLFPTSDSSAFSSTVTRAIAVEHPPPIGNNVTATGLDVLGDVVRTGYFTPGIAHRLLVVLTDGESRDFGPAAVRRAFPDPPPVQVIVVRAGAPD